MSAEADIQEAVAETVNTQDNTKPAGYDPVDLSDLPPEKAKVIEDRIDYIYGQLKNDKRTLNEYKSLAAQQSDAIAELRSGVGQVVDHLKNEKFTETENALEQKMQEAFEAGDHKAYVKVQKQLIDLKTKQAITAQKPPRQEVRQNLGQPAQNATQLANEAVDGGEISPQEAQYIQAWSAETDERGQTLRPWTVNNDPSDPDPDFVKAAMIADRFFKQNPNANINQVLAEVDKKMGVTKSSGQTVMGGNLTTPRKTSTMRLTPQQERIAVKTKYAGPKATDAEHIDRYRKQLEEVNKAKGAR